MDQKHSIMFASLTVEPTLDATFLKYFQMKQEK